MRNPLLRAASSRRNFEKAEMGQRVPFAWATLGRGVCWVLGNEARDGLIVAKNCGRLDIAASDFGMRGEYCERAIERAVPDGGIDECVSCVFRSDWNFRHCRIIISLRRTRRIRFAPRGGRSGPRSAMISSEQCWPSSNHRYTLPNELKPQLQQIPEHRHCGSRPA